MSPTWLIDLDQELFHLVNTTWSNSFSDYIFPLMRNRLIWVPLYIFILTYLILFYKRKAWIVIGGLIMTIFISDTISSKVIKPFVKRPRPCQLVQRMEVQTRVGCGSGYSFPSSHATNHFALAMFMSGLMGLKRKTTVIWVTWAAVIGFAQVYVGVHYPVDVMMGSFLGLFIGLRCVRLVLYWLQLQNKQPA